MCGLSVTSGGNPTEGMGDGFHLHCQCQSVKNNCPCQHRSGTGTFLLSLSHNIVLVNVSLSPELCCCDLWCQVMSVYEICKHLGPVRIWCANYRL